MVFFYSNDNNGHIIRKNALHFVSYICQQLRELIRKSEHEGESSDKKTKFLTLAMYLINNKADIYIKNNRGQYVLDVTQNPNIRSLLKEGFEKNR